ncbi:polysaccharide lyase [Rhabdaerophilum sp. SD176]|uniref:polysaccharide lyase n=1 Tax=Rhabdaerophilum sp. SD176 TaxID=2983548 RepID=UPI0024DFCEE8|nr:polysaccharide lyase [Rhabdaerophilum sp. SD176]
MLSLAVFGAHAQEKWQSLLSDNFEFNDFSKDSGLFYKMNKEQAKGVVRFQSDVVKSGKQALELSVVPSCAVSGTECSERAEVWEKPDILAPYDRPLWYAFSFRLGDPIPQEDHRLVMAQWKREILKGADGNYSPFLALRLSRGRLIATVVSDEATYAPKGVSPRLNRCLEHESPAAAPDAHRQVRATVAMEAGLEVAAQELPGCATNIRTISRGGEWPKASSGWIDYVFMVKPDPAGNGRIEIAANGKWVATVEGAIGHRGPGLDKTQYFKFGPYRAGRPDKWTLYYDNFRRSGSCIDVASQALCASMAAAQKSN